MRTIDTSTLEQLFSAETAYVWLPALSLESAATRFHLVANMENITVDGVVYLACPFEFSMPNDDEESPPQIETAIDAVGPVGKALIRQFQSLTVAPTGKVALIRGYREGTAWQFTEEFAQSGWTVTSLGVTATAITLTMGFDMNILNEPATIGRFIPAVAPGLFR